MQPYAQFRETPGGFKATNRNATLALSGLIGGVAGYVLSKIAGNGESVTTPAGLRAYTGFWFMLVVLGIGAAIIGGNAILNKQNPDKELLKIAIPALLVGGFVSGYLAQALYSSMVDFDKVFSCDGDRMCIASAIRPARTLGWGLAGLLGGAAVGSAFRSLKRIQNGVIGGLIGGLLGGLLFDLVAAGGGEGSRVIAICIVGVLMGTLIGLIDTARTTMWLEVIGGELRGRQFPVMDSRTTVGCASSANVRLAGDRGIRELHFTIDGNTEGAVLSCSAHDPVLVNGQPVSTSRLSNGDVVRVGSTDLRVGFRKASMSPAPAYAPQQYAPQAAPPPPGDHRSRPTAAQASNFGNTGSQPHPPAAPYPSTPSAASPPPPGAAPGRARPRLNVQSPTESDQ